MKLNHRKIAGYLSVILGLIYAIASIAISMEVLFRTPKYPDPTMFEFVFLFILICTIYYCGYIGYKFLGGTLLHKNSILILIINSLDLISYIIEIIFIRSRNENSFSILFSGLLGTLLGISLIINGISLLKKQKLPSIRSIFKISLYLLIIAIIGIILIKILVLTDYAFSSPYEKYIEQPDNNSTFYNEYFEVPSSIIGVVLSISLIIGIPLFVISGIIILIKKIKHNR